jgi:purine-cytosine permease-like protein
VDGLVPVLALVGVLIGWFALNRWVLPRFGIQT